MTDRMIEEIRRVGNFRAGTDDAEVWREYIDYFTGLPSFNRKQILRFVDEDCFAHVPAVTKNVAKLLQRRRELEDLNEKMLRSGR